MRVDPALYDAVWAGLRSGLYVTPINWHLTAAEAGYILADCGATALVASASLREVVAARALEPLPEECEGSWMFYSSGTTGRPKGIVPPLPGAALGAPSMRTGALRRLHSRAARVKARTSRASSPDHRRGRPRRSAARAGSGGSGRGRRTPSRRRGRGGRCRRRRTARQETPRRSTRCRQGGGPFISPGRRGRRLRPGRRHDEPRSPGCGRGTRPPDVAVAERRERCRGLPRPGDRHALAVPGERRLHR